MGKADRTIRSIGILTAGGDCPGLNAAIRGVGKAALEHDIMVVGILEGFRGLVEKSTRILRSDDLSGILTAGGTILGTSRDKPHKMPVAGKKMDMTAVAVDHYHQLHLDALVCLGGNGTQKNAMRLMDAGDVNIITLPKTIDNDVWGTEITFGFDTAVSIATDAIDRLHSTAESHHRIMLVEIMGHKAGWLALTAGLAGGADVILLPEIPYDIEVVAEALVDRERKGKGFSIVAVAEGALPCDPPDEDKKGKKKDDGPSWDGDHPVSELLAMEIEKRTDIDTRVTVLGHLQRGGTPTAFDRQLATRLGTAAMDYLLDGKTGVLVAAKGEEAVAVPLQDVAGKTRTVPLDHPLVKSARAVGTCLGDG